jgi:protein phosphatase 2C
MQNVFEISLIGKRDENEDHHKIILNLDGKNPELSNINFYGVFDGHGGAYISEFLMNNLYKYFIKKKVKYPVSKKYIVDSYDQLQNHLKKTKLSYRQGSTALSVIHYKHLEKEFINIVNVGDSRAVVCNKDNFAIPLSKDHKPNQPEEKTRLKILNAPVTMDSYGDWRVKQLSVSRSFGDYDTFPFVTHRPDIFNYRLYNDKFIILGCDGLWDCITNQDAVDYVLNNCYQSNLKQRIIDHGNIADELAKEAIRKGSTDNVTVIIVFLN